MDDENEVPKESRKKSSEYERQNREIAKKKSTRMERRVKDDAKNGIRNRIK